MASESSSAVLELNDADTEDTEAITVTDDTHEGVPLIMEHGYDIAVKVDGPMKQLSTLETYVTYRVRCVCARWATPTHVRRRYNHFKVLHKRLSAAHPLLAPPPLPPLHSARQQLDRYSPTFVALRTCALNAFLDRVAKHPILTYSEDFRIFLTTPDDELDKVFKSESSALNLWGLSTALYSSGESKTANGPRVKDPEFTAASDYLQSLQHKLTTLCNITTKLHKSTAALSNGYMAMKRCCDAWSSQASGVVCGAVCGAAAGAAAAASATASRPGARHSALLPLLAAYANATQHKIQQRDQIHAAYVAGTNTTDDLHNRLEQASEALRSELSDWIPKTHHEIKALLLELAERQVNIHTQTLLGWEHAYKFSMETNIDDIFKTVSKTAVQNLSPSKCRSEMTPTETERDLDDLSEEFDVNSRDSESNEFDEKNDGDGRNHSDGNGVKSDGNGVKSERNGVKSERNGVKSEENGDIKNKVDGNELSVDNYFKDLQEGEVKNVKNLENIQDVDNEILNDIEGVKIVDKTHEKMEGGVENVVEKTQDDVLNDILEDTACVSKPKSEIKYEISDPLREFTDVDLS